MEATVRPDVLEMAQKRRLSKDTIQKYALLGSLVIVIIGFGIVNPRFLGVDNFLNIARQISINLIIAVGMTYCMIQGGFDLSVGSVGIMSGCVAGVVMAETGSTFLGMIVGLACGTTAGFITGIVISRLNVNAFVATLGMMVAARGIALLATGGLIIAGLPDSFTFIGVGYLFGIPVPILICAAVVLIGYVILSYTEFGLNVYAVGGNREAANLAGLKTKTITLICFTMQGTLAALGGLVLVGRVVSAQPALMTTTNLDVIAATVVGGVSLGGGRGGIGGTILGAALIGTLFNGLNVIGVSYSWQQVIIGIVIVGAVALDQLKTKKDR